MANKKKKKRKNIRCLFAVRLVLNWSLRVGPFQQFRKKFIYRLIMLKFIKF